MASYKLIQDVEAEDKLIGPLSFRQFIYALIAAAMLYFSYLLYIHHGELVDIVTIPIALFAAFLAYPFGKDQPTEVWALAKLRFFVKPRRRIWAQSGIKELVTINVPKKVEIQRTNGLNQNEVESRLQALANTIDSRGWVTKNVDSTYQSPLEDQASDRLISAQNLPQNVPEIGLDSDDPFDEQTSPIAQQVDQLLNATADKHRAELLENLNTTRANAPAVAAPPKPGIVEGTPVNQPGINMPADSELEQRLKNAYLNSRSPLNNMHAIRTQVSPNATVSTTPGQPSSTQSTAASNPVIMGLSQRNDWNLNVISNEANKALPNESGPDEVLISLH